MKKSIIVLLIAVLVAGCAFAGTIKGYAALEFNVDLQPEAGVRTWAFNNDKAWKYSFKFDIDTTAVEVKGETNLWAELAIEGAAWIGISNATDAGGNVTGAYTVKLSKANIHIGEDITIGILSEGEGPDFAWSYRVDDTGAPMMDMVLDDHEAENIGGFTVTYKEWFGGFGAKGRWDTDPAQFTFYGHGTTPEFKFVDDQVVVQAGGYAAYSNTNAVFERATFIGAGASAQYVSDSLNAYVGADAMYDEGAVAYEALAQASYVINEDGTVGADAYLVDNKTFDADAMYLNARVWGEYTLGLSDDIDLYLYAEADAGDILSEDFREVEVYAEQSTEINGIGISLDEDYMILNRFLMVNAKIDYTAEKFYAWVKTGAWLAFDADPMLVRLPFECGIKSEAIIDKAEIGLKYTRADFAKFNDPDKVDDAGLITAYVKIGFDSSAE